MSYVFANWSNFNFEQPWKSSRKSSLVHDGILKNTYKISSPEKTFLVGGFNPSENISQNGSFPQVVMNKKYNHHRASNNCSQMTTWSCLKKNESLWKSGRAFHETIRPSLQVAETKVCQFQHEPPPSKSIRTLPQDPSYLVGA